MVRKTLLLIVACIIGIPSFAQIQTGIYFSSDKKYTEIMEDLGNPLPGNPVMIVKTFVPKYGSYVWFLNESQAKNSAYFDNNPKDLHAGIFLEDHGGLLPQIAFKDFAVGLAQPKYLINSCEVEDTNNDGFPEFYLTYFEESDGLDAKPLKVIVYTCLTAEKFSKSKITAWIPFQSEDQYREEKDTNFRLLPQDIGRKAEKILKEAKKSIM